MIEQEVTGKAYRVLLDTDTDTWGKVSFWTSAEDVEFTDSGKTLPQEMDLKATKANPSFTGSISLENNSTNGTGSSSLGTGCSAAGNNSMSQGDSNSVSGDASFAGGNNTSVSGDNSIGYGEGIDNPYDNTAVFGKFNKTTDVDDVLLVVGNGTSDNARANAMEVKNNGDVKFSGSVTAENISSSGSLIVNGDVTGANGEKLSDKLDIDDLKSNVDYSSSIMLRDVIKIGDLNVGDRSDPIYAPVPDFSVTNPSVQGYIANKPTIPSTASDLTVIGGSDLQTYLDNLETTISNIPKYSHTVVNALPTTNISTETIYLLVSSDPKTLNMYDEYINTTGTTAGWELIGSQSGTIDLQDYYTKAETEQLIEDAINDIFSQGQAGQFLVSDGNGGYNWVTLSQAESVGF